MTSVGVTQEWRHFKFNDGRMSWRLNEDPDYYAAAVRGGDAVLISAVLVGHRRKHKEAA